MITCVIRSIEIRSSWLVNLRGLHLDRNGIVLASNYSAYTLEITPSRVGKSDELNALIDSVAPSASATDPFACASNHVYGVVF